ncbi:MAG: HAMP domain-containing histidine kinase [Clostridiales bacterium]|nr:HAMP domain-containing histidine kinase [Clostridiales bacterium]
MKRLNQAFVFVIILFVTLIVGANYFLMSNTSHEDSRPYRVEINRIHNEIEHKGIGSINLDNYSCISNITVLDDQDGFTNTAFFEGKDSDYVIRWIAGSFYRIDYKPQDNHYNKAIHLGVNIVIGFIFIIVMGFLIYIKHKIIKPFHLIQDVPYELSKGNLSVGLKENRSRYFGKFVWGLDLLREKLEEQKQKDLDLQKEKKTLVLSLSHDIKTPLSAIKLYSKALIKNLYDSQDKRTEAAQNINKLADEIEGYVSDIIKTSREDFLNMEVTNGEFYIDDLINKTNAYYTEKLDLKKIEFHIEKYNNCLLQGELDRAIEVVQNIMENAIKYGDGRKIYIRIKDEEDCRLITVANTGCSLLENELPYLFNSFWRGSNIGNNGGSGLGLYICRQLMLKMHGDIYAECKGEEMQVTAVFRKL